MLGGLHIRYGRSGEKCLDPVGIRTRDHPAQGQVVIPNIFLLFMPVFIFVVPFVSPPVQGAAEKLDGFQNEII
jgi:hypothetical protein